MHLRRGTRAALVAAVVLVATPALTPPASAQPTVAAQAARAGACTIVGTPGDDVLIGTDRRDVICGLGGDDKILGRGGDDLLRGGGGSDVVRGGRGDDRVAGGRGDDRVFGQGGDDVVRGDSGDDKVVGGPGNDRMGGFRGADELIGTDGPSTIDTMNCGPGPDVAEADPDDVVMQNCETVTQNDPPTDITLAPSAISENEAIGADIGDLTAADPDAGDTHTFTLVPGAGSADNHLVRIDGDSLESAVSYDFEADPSLSVRVRATDEAGEFTEKVFTVTVTDANDAPVAVDDDATATEDTQLDLPVSGAGSPASNDTDQDGDPLTVSAVSSPTGGTVSLSGGQVHFVPGANLCGPDAGTFVYTVSDGVAPSPGTDTGTVTVDITCIDDAPTAVDDDRTVGEDSGATALNVLTNDSDPESDPIAVTGATDPANGGTTFTAGDVSYTPDADYCNDPPPFDTFTYTVNGGDTATVRVTVTCVNDAPVAVDDDRTTPEDTPLQDPVTGAGSPAANDTDVDAGDTLTVTSVTNAVGGTVDIAAGQITFTPAANSCAPTPASYDYVVSDGNGGTDTGKVTVDVTCVNDAPVANDDSRTVAEDSGPTTFVTLLTNDTDVESDPITITGASDPANGSTSFTANDVTYTPDADFCGADSFTYTVNGGDTATVSVTVTCVNDAPVAVDDSASVVEDAAAGAVDVLGNDDDVEGDPVTISSASDPANGAVVLTGGTSGAHTGLTYAPDADYCNDPPGTIPDTFTYTVNGGDTATVSVTVTCVDDDPTADDDTATVTLNDPATAVDVLANDDDIDGGPMAIASASDPANGTVVLTGGTPGAHTGLTYEPDTGYCNTDPVGPADTFTYALTPGGDTATVSVTVTCDVPPVGADDTATVAEDANPTAIDVLANDSDGGDGGVKAIASTTQPADGTVVLTGGTPGAHTGLTYEPDPDYCNDPGAAPDDTFTYTLTPGGDTAQVAVTVTCVNDDPNADDDAVTVAEDSGATTVDVLANDDDVEGDPITVTGATDPANGSTTFTAADVSYTPDPDFCGADSFDYTVNGGDTATVSVTVTCVPDAPSLVNSAGTTTYTEDTAPVAVDGTVTISNPDGLDITAGSVTLSDDLPGDVLDWTDNNPADSIVEGTSTALQVNLTGTGTANQWEAALEAVTFATPSQNPSGADRTATFQVTTSAGSPTDTKLVDAANVDDPPTADDDAETVLEDAAATAVPVLANDDDVDGGPMTIASATQPGNGTVVLTGPVGAHTGLTYQPDPDYCNDPPGTTPDTFTYTLDGASADPTATVSMTVTCVNDAPVADDESFSGTSSAIGNTSLVVDDPTDGAPDPAGPQRTVTGDILDGDTDIDGPNPLVITSTGTFATNDGGSVTLEADGDFTYVSDPADSCNDASDFFDYTISDGNTPTAGTDVGRVTIAVTECVWYADAGAGAGNGTSASPFNNLTAVNGAGGAGDLDGADDYLFLYGGGAFSTGIILETGQRLFGQPQGLTVDGTALEAATGTRPNLYNATVGAAGITLANGSEVRGVNAGQAGTASSFGIRGVGVTTSTVGANVGIVDNSIGFGLQGSAGGNVSVAATISGNTGAAVSVQQRTSGTVTVSGDVTASGLNSTVEAVNNAGATIDITGKLDLSGAAQTALDLRQGGTLSVTNAANTITGVTGGLATAVNLDGVTIGAGGVTLNTVSTAGGGAANGILVNNVTGTGAVTVGGGTLTTSTRGLDVNGGTGNVTMGNAFEPTAGRSVEVTGHTSGTVDVNGPVNDDANGINLTGNTGATIRFDGGLVASTGTNAAFNATGGGTVVVTGAANTLTTTTGTALNVANTTIGADGLTFRSISSNGAANGIVLNTTGATGGLTVSGNGGSCMSAVACTGGAIQNATVAVSLTSTRDVAIDRMFIQNTSDSGVKGTTTTNFAFTNGRIDNSGTGLGAETSNIGFNTTAAGTENNLSGVVTITGNTLTNAYYHGIDIFNFSGTISNATISNNTITSTTSTATSKGGGIRLVGFGSASTIANITTATLNANTVSNFPSGSGIQVQAGNGNLGGGSPAGTYGSAGSPIALTNNVVSGQSAANRMGAFGLAAAVNGKGTGFYNITGNSLSNTFGTALSVSSFGFATTTATVANNTIVANNAVGSQGIGAGTGAVVAFNETPTLNITVTGNAISQTDGNGILLVARDSAGTLNAGVRNNNVAAPLGGLRPGIRVDAGNANSTDDAVCLDISDNTSDGTGGGTEGIGLRKQGTVAGTNDFGIEGMGATATPGVEAYVNGLNPAANGTLLISATSGFSNCSSAP
ncbi:Ig-like domain-containing protein [Nocardioides dilutus]